MGKHDHASYLKEIESKINLLQKQHSIIWLKNDWFEPEEIVQLFSHASVYCCPSIYETFGLVAVEAMACGTPVVATDIGGLNETIAHRKTGFLAPF
jgi:glycosyltransferase involved in cell wall biosynthesis